MPVKIISRILFSLVLASVLSIIAVAQTRPAYPFQNSSLPIDKRVDDLVGRMTLEEKVSQMDNGAKAIPRLGIPEYEWWNEALHGVARAGTATVFPQAIGLAATFNEKMVWQVADATSTEARAKYNYFQSRNDRGRYKGLTFWTPNINIFRDPRWGRGQETWGEDPFLTGTLGSAFVRGLQGNDPKYLKTVSTVKHFAVHSGPEADRHSFNAVVSEKDLRETYLPAFRQTIVEAGATGIMCAYNRLYGLPACASDLLLKDILRGEWNFKGHVVTDCGAVYDMYMFHNFAKTEAESSALALKSGTDLTCGGEYRSLTEAVKKNLASEADVTKAVKNLMQIRFRLGMFDPPAQVKYSKIPYSENDSPVHRALALQSARESLVLLKNANQTLPLSKNLKTIAVIGPNADAPDVLLGNYNGTPSKSVTPYKGIQNKLPNAKVVYAQGMYPTGVIFEPISAVSLSSDNRRGLKGEYFNNRELKGTPVLVRYDEQINFQWDSDTPAEQIVPNNFSVRWTGKITAQVTGKYQFGWRSNGGIKIYLDNKLVIEELKNPRTRNVLKEIDFEKGKSYDVRIEYFENNNEYASAKLVWTPPGAQEDLRRYALEKAKDADAVVMVMGLSPTIEGEEMEVKVEGFNRGDRTEIALPVPQLELIKAVHQLGKPVVLVTMGGSALALNWENENLPAILQSWYPGEEGGTAIADVLFGDYNPAGRLPVTFYKSVNDLPAFDDYKMDGRTYRYFRGAPLYPFGYGLSYTKFAYENLKFKNKIAAGEDLEISATVKNTGKIAGDEVVQLYLSDSQASVSVPVRSLVCVQRINLKPGEARRVSFKVTPRQMSAVMNDGRRIVEPGEFSISFGGKQPGFSGSTDAQTTSVIQNKFSVTGNAFQLAEK
jgi:beta-glucosidase